MGSVSMVDGHIDGMNELERYAKERDEMLLKCDVNEFRKFVKEHEEMYTPLFADAIVRASDELIEMTLHKMIVHCEDLPFDFRQKSADWLLDKGLSLNI